MTELTEDRVRELINETVGTVPVLAKYLQKQFWSDLPYASAQVPSFDGTNLKFKPTSLAAGHDAITMSGTPDYITLSGQDIVRGSIDLAADVTGDLPYANLTPSANASRVLARTSASAGDWQECTLSTGLTMNGTILTVAYDSANFTGTNWTDLTDGGATTLHSHAGGSGHTIREDGTGLTARTGLNFVDTDVAAAVDDAAGDETEIRLNLYAALAGRVGGQTITGGTGSGENLTLQATSHITPGLVLLSASKLRLAASPNNIIQDSSGTTRMTVAAGGALTIADSGGTTRITIVATPLVTVTGALRGTTQFAIGGVVQSTVMGNINDNGAGTDGTIGLVANIGAASSAGVSTSIIGISGQAFCKDANTVEVYGLDFKAGGGAAATGLTGLYGARVTGFGVSGAVTGNYYGFYSKNFTDPTISAIAYGLYVEAFGVGATRVGVHIEKQTGGATANIGLRNAGTTVYTPSTVQTIAAATAILADATIVQIQSTGAVTVTAAPTIADGQDGQIVTIVNVDTADTITLQDQGTLASSNLRLVTTTIALSPRDSVKLMYSSTVGDWVQIGPVVAVI